MIGLRVLKIEMVFASKDHAFKQADIQPLGDIHAEVMHSRVFPVDQGIPVRFMKLWHEFHEQVLVMNFQMRVLIFAKVTVAPVAQNRLR